MYNRVIVDSALSINKIYIIKRYIGMLWFKVFIIIEEDCVVWEIF